MKISIKPFISVLILGMGLLSCKEKQEEVVTPSGVNDMETFFEERGERSQQFTVNASTGATITGNEGTKITIPANAFVTAGGAAVTGNVTFELKEIFDKSEMILSNRPTISSGQILVSGGEFYVGASQNGNELYLDDNKLLYFEAPADSINPNMDLFIGIDSTSGFTWTPVQTSSDSTGWQDTIAGGGNNQTFFFSDNSFPYNYIYGINQMGWINCDYFWNNPSPGTTVTINFANKPGDQCAAFIVFKNINSVVRVYDWSSTYSTSGVPVGTEVTLIGVAVKDGKKYLAKSDQTITANHNATLNFSEVSDSQLESELGTLD